MSSKYDSTYGLINTCRTVSVQPAIAVNSPADNVVGMSIERTAGAFTGGRCVLDRKSVV